MTTDSVTVSAPHESKSERIARQICQLITNSDENYSEYSAEEIQALSLAAISHRRMIRTVNFNQLVREFETRTHEKTNNYRVEWLYAKYSEELEKHRFNFQHSSVSIEFSDSALSRLLEMSRGERLSHPRVLNAARRFAKQLEAQARNECRNVAHVADDFEQDLLMYLTEKAENNFDPSKSSYITYAITTLRFRARILMAGARLRNTREVITCFENDEDSGSWDEKLQVDESSVSGSSSRSLQSSSFTSSSCGLASHQHELSASLQSFFDEFSPLEKTLLFLKNQLGCNINTFGFDVSTIVADATRRASVGILS